MRCRICGAPMRDGEGTCMIPWKGEKVLVGGLKAHVCTACGMTVLREGEKERAIRILKGGY